MSLVRSSEVTSRHSKVEIRPHYRLLFVVVEQKVICGTSFVTSSSNSVFSFPCPIPPIEAAKINLRTNFMVVNAEWLHFAQLIILSSSVHLSNLVSLEWRQYSSAGYRL